MPSTRNILATMLVLALALSSGPAWAMLGPCCCRSPQPETATQHACCASSQNAVESHSCCSHHDSTPAEPTWLPMLQIGCCCAVVPAPVNSEERQEAASLVSLTVPVAIVADRIALPAPSPRCVADQVAKFDFPDRPSASVLFCRWLK